MNYEFFRHILRHFDNNPHISLSFGTLDTINYPVKEIVARIQELTASQGWTEDSVKIGVKVMDWVTKPERTVNGTYQLRQFVDLTIVGYEEGDLPGPFYAPWSRNNIDDVPVWPSSLTLENLSLRPQAQIESFLNFHYFLNPSVVSLNAIHDPSAVSSRPINIDNISQILTLHELSINGPVATDVLVQNLARQPLQGTASLAVRDCDSVFWGLKEFFRHEFEQAPFSKLNIISSKFSHAKSHLFDNISKPANDMLINTNAVLNDRSLRIVFLQRPSAFSASFLKRSFDKQRKDWAQQQLATRHWGWLMKLGYFNLISEILGEDACKVAQPSWGDQTVAVDFDDFAFPPVQPKIMQQRPKPTASTRTPMSAVPRKEIPTEQQTELPDRTNKRKKFVNVLSSYSDQISKRLRKSEEPVLPVVRPNKRKISSDDSAEEGQAVKRSRRREAVSPADSNTDSPPPTDHFTGEQALDNLYKPITALYKLKKPPHLSIVVPSPLKDLDWTESVFATPIAWNERANYILPIPRREIDWQVLQAHLAISPRSIPPCYWKLDEQHQHFPFLNRTARLAEFYCRAKVMIEKHCEARKLPLPTDYRWTMAIYNLVSAMEQAWRRLPVSRLTMTYWSRRRSGLTMWYWIRRRSEPKQGKFGGQLA
ncbi:hypothetical protein BT69DRAFT_1290393 [Atractiella rhizophila]|nr:hypothetical protein BT69DRAFT_1290393 [Atractiella rhizophila]